MEYIAQEQSIKQVANAIREKTGDPALLEFPDEFVVAIRSIQPQQTDVIGGTLGWNQSVKNGNFAEGTAEWSSLAATLSASDGILTVTKDENTGIGVGYARQNGSHLTLNHKYIFSCEYKGIAGKQLTVFTNNLNAGMTSVIPTDSNWHTVQKIVNIITMPSVDCLFWLNYATTTGDNVAQFRNIYFIDLTTLLGSTIADKIYTLEQSIRGAGVAIIKQLLTKDYYPCSLPVLSSIMYANDWENFGDSYILNGFLRLSDNSLYRWGDILSNGNVTRKTARIAMTDLTWTSGTMAAYEATLPNWIGSNGIEPILETVISDAYPTALYDVWSGLTPTDLSTAPDKYLYQIYESQSPDTKYYKIYIKDTSIATVSDLMTALAGKEIVYAISDENYAVAGKRYRGRADIDLPDARTLTFGNDPEYAYFYRSPGVEQAVTQIIVTATKVSYINENGNEIEVARIDSGLQWDGDDYGQLIWFGDNAPDMSPEDYEWFISLYEEII